MGKGQAKPILYKKETRAVFGCSWPTQFWEATVVFETGFPKPEPGTPTVRFLCEERTPPWKTMGPLEDSHHRETTNYTYVTNASRPPAISRAKSTHCGRNQLPLV